MASRTAFLARVRQALQADVVHGPTVPGAGESEVRVSESAAEVRARLTRQRADLVQRLQSELSAVGGVVTQVRSIAEVTEYVTQLAREQEATLLVRWQSELLEGLEIDAALEPLGVNVHATEVPKDGDASIDMQRQEMRELLARADIGLSGVDCAVASTGTLALTAAPGQMRGVSLLPPVHVAVVKSEQIVATLADYLTLLQVPEAELQANLTSCISFITGPSRTGDIELSLTIGVHGPGALHLLVLDEAEMMPKAAEEA